MIATPGENLLAWSAAAVFRPGFCGLGLVRKSVVRERLVTLAKGATPWLRLSSRYDLAAPGNRTRWPGPRRCGPGLCSVGDWARCATAQSRFVDCGLGRNGRRNRRAFVKAWAFRSGGEEVPAVILEHDCAVQGFYRLLGLGRMGLTARSRAFVGWV